MDWFIFVPVLIWLGILSWYDIKTREIPHSAWVIIPLILAGVYRVWLGGWQLVLLAVIVLAASERGWIAEKMEISMITKLNWWIPLLGLGVLLVSSISPIGVMAILGFWIAWELKWWGGADAVVGVILILLRPEICLIIAIIIAHITYLILLKSCFGNNNWRYKFHPGLPIFFISVCLFLILG